MKIVTTLAAVAALALGVASAAAQQQPVGGGGGILEGTAPQEGGGQVNPSRGVIPPLNAGPGANPTTGSTIVAPVDRGARGAVVPPENTGRALPPNAPPR
ncbi:MAG: hypothetical protein ACJ8F3_11105 [Xanthobacteraceae bacterium]